MQSLTWSLSGFSLTLEYSPITSKEIMGVPFNLHMTNQQYYISCAYSIKNFKMIPHHLFTPHSSLWRSRENKFRVYLREQAFTCMYVALKMNTPFESTFFQYKLWKERLWWINSFLMECLKTGRWKNTGSTYRRQAWNLYNWDYTKYFCFLVYLHLCI